MNQKAKQILFLVGAVAILILLWLFRPHSSPPAPVAKQVETIDTSLPNAVEKPASPSNAENLRASQALSQSAASDSQALIKQNERDMQSYSSMWRTSLLYYGKVVDQSNQPISGVQVSYGGNSVNESLTEETYNKGMVTTDNRGIFKIDGILGIGLMFQLHHSRYYSYPDNSTGFDVRSPPKDGVVPDSEVTARVFRMHSKGNPVALIDRNGGLHKPADGTAMDFPLRGRVRSEIIGQLQAQAWKGEPDPQNNGQYDWKVKITMPGGGVLATSNEFDFVAPESGYQLMLEIGMSKDDPNWTPSASKTLFFKLPKYFARGQAHIDLYHDFYFSMQYYVNPDGSANLENDPSQPFQEP